MNWEAIGAIGEWFGAVAVLATLVYLAVQVRHARNGLQQSVLQNRDQAVRHLMLEAISSPTLSSAFAKGSAIFGGPPAHKALQEAADLTLEEAQAFSSYTIAWWFYRAETIRNISQLSDSQREDFDSNIFGSYSTGLGKVWFDEWKLLRSPDDPTLRYCNNVLAKRGST
jgi:hypothetical protein